MVHGFSKRIFIPHSTDGSSWLLLGKKIVPSKISELLKDLYSNTVIQVDGQMSDWFVVTAGMWQGCVVAPDMFPEPTDWIGDMHHSLWLRQPHAGKGGLHRSRLC